MPAYAGVSEDFSECDGLKKPKSSDDGMRGEVTFPSYRFGGRDAPSQTLAAKIAASNHQHPDHDTESWPSAAGKKPGTSR